MTSRTQSPPSLSQQTQQESECTTQKDVEEVLHEYHVLTEGQQELYSQHKDKGRLRLTQETMEKLKPGDIVQLYYYKLRHLIVVESVRTRPDKPPDFIIIDAIHYGRSSVLTPNTVMRETFELSLNTQKSWLLVFPPASCYPAQAVLQRARNRLNEEEYNRISNNASMFALWCKVQSPSHRQSCHVPIYKSDEHHTHEVKAGDHVRISCSDSRRIHAEVTNVEPVIEDASMVTVVAKKGTCSCLPIVHEAEHVLTKQVRKIISTQCHNGADLSRMRERVRFLNRVVYSNKILSSLSICHLLIRDQALSTDQWKKNALEVEGHSDCRELCKTVDPESLKAGDMIYLDKEYRLITNIRSRESGTTVVRTVQYCAEKDKCTANDLIEFKIWTRKKEKSVSLCVHNEAKLDCELYGGGREKSVYSAVKVTDLNNVKTGSVISFRSQEGFSMQIERLVSSALLRKHAVVIQALHQADSEKSDEKQTKLMCEVMTYVLKPSLSTQMFEVALQTCELDIGEESKQDVHLITYNVGDDRKFSPEKVVERAFSRKGERDHNWMWNSDRDFARWCSIEHGSNREQCRVDINSAEDLVRFGRGHIKFPKLFDIYTHDAIMRECTQFEDSNEIVKVHLYENNKQFRSVRKEELKISAEETIRRFVYNGFSRSDTRMDLLEQLLGVTFLNTDDDKMSFIKWANQGSRVTSQDFCYWLKNKNRQGLKDIEGLFGTHLERMQKDLRLVNKFGTLSSQPGESVFVEDNVNRSSLRQFDHVILKRRVQGKVKDVHFILVEWDPESSSGFGVTYEAPAEEVKMGINEFIGFLRVNGPGQLQKVVHNADLDWERIDAKFDECRGARNYHLFSNNCEHFVNFLIYGRFTSLQLSDWAWTAISIWNSVEKYSEFDSKILRIFADISPAVPDGRTSWSEGFSLASGLVFAFIVAVLEFRKATTGMPEHEYRWRFRSLKTSVGSSLAGLLIAIGLGTSWLPCMGIAASAFAVSNILPRVPAIWDSIFTP